MRHWIKAGFLLPRRRRHIQQALNSLSRKGTTFGFLPDRASDCLLASSTVRDERVSLRHQTHPGPFHGPGPSCTSCITNIETAPVKQQDSESVSVVLRNSVEATSDCSVPCHEDWSRLSEYPRGGTRIGTDSPRRSPGLPFCNHPAIERTAKLFGLEPTLRAQGRPHKISP